MTKQNPYERVERIGRKVEGWLYPVLFILMLTTLFVVYPVYAMIQGVIWYQAFMPLWGALGICAVLLALVSGYVGVRALWITKKQEWERKNRG